MYSLKNILGVYLIEYFWAKNYIFGGFWVNKCDKLPVFGAIFVYFGQHGAYLPPLTPSTTTPAQGLPPPIVGVPSSFWAAFKISGSF